MNLNQAQDRVGPGWAHLVAAAHHHMTESNRVVLDVMTVEGTLQIIWTDAVGTGNRQMPHRERRTALRRWMAWLFRVSGRTCEACGNPGSIIERFDDEYGRALRTLCDRCAFRWKEGSNQWTTLRGERDPLDDLIDDVTDDIDPDEDTDEGRREPRWRPRPTTGSGMAKLVTGGR